MKRNPFVYLLTGTFLLMLICPSIIMSQNISISDNGTTQPDASAMLDIVSPSKGLLIPRVSLSSTGSASPVTNPATSLLVYNTNTVSDVVKGYYYWDGTKWVPIGRVGWELTGNDISGSPTNFLGTTSNNDLIIKTNNTEKVRVLTGGNVGIGTSSPNEKLVVVGNVKAGTATPNTLIGTNSTYGNTYAAFWKDGADYSLLTEGTNTFLNAPTASGNIYLRSANTDKAILLGASGNFGIAKTNPSEKLDVEGSIRFSTALMPNNDPGTIGDILTSRGPGTYPVWKAPGDLIKANGCYSTRTYISSTSFTQVTGLSMSVTVAQTSLLLITTYGAIETTATNSSGGTGTVIQIFKDGVGLTVGEQTIDVANTSGYYALVTPWCITTFLNNVAAGTYTFDVRARKYIGSDFYAGGSTTSPLPNEGALTILVIPQ
jgi:hypothetical protein